MKEIILAKRNPFSILHKLNDSRYRFTCDLLNIVKFSGCKVSIMRVYMFSRILHSDDVNFNYKSKNYKSYKYSLKYISNQYTPLEFGKDKLSNIVIRKFSERSSKVKQFKEY